MKIVGTWSGHDCSFCVLDDGKPVVHAEYERYIREKEPQGDSLQFMFDNLDDYEDIKYFATSHSLGKLKKYQHSYQKLIEIIKKNDGNLFVLGHHQCHAANAFFSSNFEKAIIFTIDGGGVESSEGFLSAFTVWKGEDNKIEPVKIFPIQEVNIGGV